MQEKGFQEKGFLRKLGLEYQGQKAKLVVIIDNYGDISTSWQIIEMHCSPYNMALKMLFVKLISKLFPWSVRFNWCSFTAEKLSVMF